MRNFFPKIWLYIPHMGGKEFQYIHKAFDENWVAPLGSHVTNFEEKLAELCKIPHFVALSS